MSTSEKNNPIQWLEKVSEDLDLDIDILDSMSMEEVNQELADLGVPTYAYVPEMHRFIQEELLPLQPQPEIAPTLFASDFLTTHNRWVALTCVLWGLLTWFTGGFITSAFLSTSLSPTPEVTTIVSTSVYDTVSALDFSVRSGLVYTGLGLVVLGVFGLLFRPTGFSPWRSKLGDYLHRLRYHWHVVVGLLLFLTPELASQISQATPDGYFWGLGIFTVVSGLPVFVTTVFLKRVFDYQETPRIILGFTVLIALVLGVGNSIVGGTWLWSVLFIAALPGSFLLVWGLRELKKLHDQKKAHRETLEITRQEQLEIWQTKRFDDRQNRRAQKEKRKLRKVELVNEQAESEKQAKHQAEARRLERERREREEADQEYDKLMAFLEKHDQTEQEQETVA